MLFQNTAHSYVCPMLNTRRRQPLISFGQLKSILDEKCFLQTTAKVALIVLFCALVARFWMGVVVNDIDESIMVHKQESHVLIDKNIALRAQKAYLLSPQRIERVAAEKLALYAPVEGQVRYVN